MTLLCRLYHYRNRKKHFLLLTALVFNIVLFIYFAFIQSGLPIEDLHWNSNDNFRVTLIMNEFENFENDLQGDLLHFKSIFGRSLQLFIVTEKLPYPPLKIKLSDNLKLFNLDFDLNRPAGSEMVQEKINTEFVLFVPGGARIRNVSNLYSAVEELKTNKLVRAVAIQTGTNKLTCPGFRLELKRWTVKFEDFSGTAGHCDFIDGNQAILLRTSDLRRLASPFTRPTHYSIYFQLALKRWKSYVFHKPVFSLQDRQFDTMNLYRHKQLEKSRLHKTYKKFGIHQIVFNRNNHELFGCNKDTERCFASVINDVPDYIYSNKWTPPCCLKAIKETAIHVFNTLEKNSVRFWLEGGSLLGAARHQDIIPWDYDVDIGIYDEDIPKCKEILKAKEQQYLDEEGFLWEKAVEGDFFRVHYSDLNRNHVDIFPFYSKNGVMTKNTWFKTHPQDTEFPEHYLKPLTNISFIGRNVSAPNSVKEFLEFKFGKGVIENPRYPNARNVF